MTGKTKYRAVTIINDVAIDGWGDNPSEAEKDLKNKIGAMVLKLSDEKTLKTKKRHR